MFSGIDFSQTVLFLGWVHHAQRSDKRVDEIEVWVANGGGGPENCGTQIRCATFGGMIPIDRSKS